MEKMPPAIAEIIKKVNESQKYVLACDITSGIENDSAKIPTIEIKANKTVTFLLINQLLLIMILFLT